MPEPNLPPLNLDSIDMDAIRESIPEMPDLTRDALSTYNLRQQEIEIMVVSRDINLNHCIDINSTLSFFFLQKYTNLLNLFLNVIQKDSSEDVVKIATILIKYQVLSACKQLKINPQDW